MFVIFLQESCNFLDPEHFNGDGYLKPILHRSQIASQVPPSAPPSAYIYQTEPPISGPDVALEEEVSYEAMDYPYLELLETKPLNKVSEMKDEVCD